MATQIWVMPVLTISSMSLELLKGFNLAANAGEKVMLEKLHFSWL